MLVVAGVVGGVGWVGGWVMVAVRYSSRINILIIVKILFSTGHQGSVYTLLSALDIL